MKDYSFFDSVEPTAEDPILGLPVLFAKDERADKINLGIGSYKNAKGQSELLASVRQAALLIAEEKQPKDYLPIQGDPQFNELMIEIVLGKNAPKANIAAFQSIGGTQALRLGAEFLAKHLTSMIFVSNPTWANHHLIFAAAGLTVEEYPYYSQELHRIEFEKTLARVRAMPPGSVMLLQTACHNPTGASFSEEEWKKLGKALQEGAILPFFDNAYQGFGISLEADRKPMELFLEMGLEMLVATSCSKNFGLYGERVGQLLFVAHHEEALKKVSSQVKKIVRSFCSTPPIHGGKIVAKILSTPDLHQLWNNELIAMRERIHSMRKTLSKELTEKSGANFNYIAHQEGFFSLVNLTEDQVYRLRTEQGFYIPVDGRINIAGLTTLNMDRTISALLSL